MHEKFGSPAYRADKAKEIRDLRKSGDRKGAKEALIDHYDNEDKELFKTADIYDPHFGVAEGEEVSFAERKKKFKENLSLLLAAYGQDGRLRRLSLSRSSGVGESSINRRGFSPSEIDSILEEMGVDMETPSKQMEVRLTVDGNPAEVRIEREYAIKTNKGRDRQSMVYRKETSQHVNGDDWEPEGEFKELEAVVIGDE